MSEKNNGAKTSPKKNVYPRPKKDKAPAAAAGQPAQGKKKERPAPPHKQQAQGKQPKKAAAPSGEKKQRGTPKEKPISLLLIF